MHQLEKAVEGIFGINLALKENEKLLILTDENKRELGRVFHNIAKRFTGSIDLVEIPVGKVHGEEPPYDAAERMLGCDVGVLLTTKSLSHTTARKRACGRGARIATMPNATEDMLKRALNVDYKEMHERIARISDILDLGDEVRILSRSGTDIRFSIRGRKAHGRTSGIFVEKGKYGNLPDGESFIAPVEGSAEGVFIIDGSIGGIGHVDRPVRVSVNGGYAERIEGGKAAERLKELLAEAGKEAGNIAEFGIGANDKAVITGNMLEDEKVLGTSHIALGNNTGFGGKVDVGLHIDGLIKKPTILIGDKEIMREGRLVFFDA
ncbi:aminopeptidase [Candidatus Woesearchaeota archaeon]|nr:aminopeptidase [Candidatus Woesearchaeota archaeon]